MILLVCAEGENWRNVILLLHQMMYHLLKILTQKSTQIIH